MRATQAPAAGRLAWVVAPTGFRITFAKRYLAYTGATWSRL